MPTSVFLAASVSPQLFAVVVAGLSLAYMAVVGARTGQDNTVQSP
jgi:hypothetical protein